MSTGSVITFSQEEKKEFNPHFSSFLQNKSTTESIKKALGGDEQKFARYQLYHNALMDVLQLREAKKNVAALEQTAKQALTCIENKALLTQSILHRQNLIKDSRKSAMEPALKLTEALRA